MKLEQVVISPSLHPTFASWGDYLQDHRENLDAISQLQQRGIDVKSNLDRFRRYGLSPEREFFKECERHAKDVTPSLESSSSILYLVHPFYPFLDPHSDAQGPQREEGKLYIQRLQNAIEKAQKDGQTIVILETAHHYPYATAHLLEGGVVNRVIFSQYASGSLVHSTNNDAFARLTITIAGGYNGRCLTRAMMQLPATSTVMPIRSLMYDHPRDNPNMFRASPAQTGYDLGNNYEADLANTG